MIFFINFKKKKKKYDLKKKYLILMRFSIKKEHNLSENINRIPKKKLDYASEQTFT